MGRLEAGQTQSAVAIALGVSLSAIFKLFLETGCNKGVEFILMDDKARSRCVQLFPFRRRNPSNELANIFLRYDSNRTCLGHFGIASKKFSSWKLFTTRVGENPSLETSLIPCIVDKLPIVQGSSMGFLVPIIAILNLPEWECPERNPNITLTQDEAAEIWMPRMREVENIKKPLKSKIIISSDSIF
ncbi:hypothetical protein TNCV_4093771 [Trichonephila clavipes]|nr:hypothetical protein TNCV_4093771 [Trichonephila clavipes]